MRYSSLALTAGILLTACASMPVEEVLTEAEPEPVSVVLDDRDTCTPMSALTRVVIPEKTETYIAITEIDNPPYEPIQSRQEMTRVVQAEQVLFVDSENREVTNICDMDINPTNTTSLSE